MLSRESVQGAEQHLNVHINMQDMSRVTHNDVAATPKMHKQFSAVDSVQSPSATSQQDGFTAAHANHVKHQSM